MHCNRVLDKKSAMCAADRRMQRQPHGWDAQFYGHCFPSLDALAMALEQVDGVVVPQEPLHQSMPAIQPQQFQENDNSNSRAKTHGTNCTSFAWSNIMGKGGIESNHLFFNLQYYAAPTVLKFPEKKVYIVLTKSLWQDLINLEQLLSSSSNDDDGHDHDVEPGPRGNSRDSIGSRVNDNKSSKQQTLFANLKGSKVSHGSESYNKTVISSPRHARNLCCGLLDELLLYRHLIEKAVNLNSLAKQTTWKRAVEICTSSTGNIYRDSNDNRGGDYKLLWRNLVRECANLRSAVSVAPAIAPTAMEISLS
jgi:hypothetical protein